MTNDIRYDGRVAIVTGAGGGKKKKRIESTKGNSLTDTQMYNRSW